MIRLLVGLGQLFCRLPLAWQMRAGRLLGVLFYYVPNRRKRIAATNIALCFKEKDENSQRQLLKKNLQATGQGVAEMMAALWAPEHMHQGRFTINGFEKLSAALSRGQGVLLLSCHTTSIEWGIRGLNAALKEKQLPIGHMLARAHNNRQLESHFLQARVRFVDKVIDKKNVRSLLQSIKAGHGVYYAPDQNFSYQCEHIEFFGEPAATTLAPAKLTHAADILAVPWFCFRTGPCEWQIEICDPIPAMGSGDHVLALTQMNALFESQIRKHPEQYLWVHRRFKNRPDGLSGVYH